MGPKVSVIIPNYNHASHLRRRIDTVIGQTYTNLEVILLDDCSTDNSREIINAYAGHPKVTQIVFNEQNSGNPFKQWQRGAQLATGQWLWIAESDDYADNTFVEKMIAMASDKPAVGLVYCDSHIVKGDEVVPETFADIKNKKLDTTRWSERHTNNGKQEIEQYLLSEGTINNTSAVLFKKDVFQEVDPFDVSFRYIGDQYTFLKVLAKADVAYVPEALNFYRNPFNSKHEGKHLNYFFEHFLIFNWVYTNLKFANKQRFFSAFYAHTQNSLGGWNKAKIDLYRKLWTLTPGLLTRSILHNFVRSLRILFFGRESINH